jgi:4-hydroxyphenylpyruvate dioxygenase
MVTPNTYYDMLSEHLCRIGVKGIQEDIERLRELGILVDGQHEGKYLMQIFLADAATQFRDRRAGPFFLELIQRKGDLGFGAGNFRALFESIERQQQNEGRS